MAQISALKLAGMVKATGDTTIGSICSVVETYGPQGISDEKFDALVDKVQALIPTAAYDHGYAALCARAEYDLAAEDRAERANFSNDW